MARNPPWQRDELILALDMYFRLKDSGHSMDDASPDVVALSSILRSLNVVDRAGVGDPVRFRNPNGCAMKLMNLRRLDPDAESRGLDAGGKAEEAVWAQFAGDLPHLRAVAAAIRQAHATENSAVTNGAEEGEEEFPEGRLLWRVHRSQERNEAVVQAAKRLAMAAHGCLECAVCAFDFGKTYGMYGRGFIEAHHIRPISDAVERRTRPSDLVLVCANCHRMLHRRRPWLSINELGLLVGSQHR
jgi:5-methylcytosine-specific restriction protein A